MKKKPKLHRLTQRVRRMLATTNGMMACDVILDSGNISERLERNEATYGDTENDIFLVRLTASSILERHKESMKDAIDEEVAPLLRKMNPYQ